MATWYYAVETKTAALAEASSLWLRVIGLASPVVVYESPTAA